MKICIMTSVHHHDDVRIYHKEARCLKHAGHDVTILCTDYEGIDQYGIRFIKVAIPSARAKRIRKAPYIFYKKAKSIHADVYHFHDPELILTGLKLKKKAKVIYDVHEDVPRQILTKPYLKPFIANISSKFVEWYEKFAAKRFYSIVAAAPVIYDRFKPINRKTVLVCNYPKLEEFANVESKRERTGNTVCYVGGITKIRGIFEMIDAVDNTNITLMLAGQYEDEKLKMDCEAKSGYKNVQYLGFLGRKEISNLLSSSKAGLVTLHPTPTYVTSLPVKMFEYMIAELPVIVSDFKYWKEIVEDAACGITVDPLNPKEITAAIEYILKNQDVALEMGQNGRKKVLEKYNWDIEKLKLIELYKNMKP